MTGAPCFDWPIIMIRPHALRLIVSRLFTVPVLFLGAGLEKSKITELCTWKKFLRGHILSTTGDAVISVRTSRYGTASMLCSSSGNSSSSHPPPWPCFSDMNVVTICCNGSAYYCLLACLLFEVLEVGCLRVIRCSWEWIKHLGISSCCI
jgi:hypothetical protein